MRKGLALAALDLMGSLLLVVYVLINPPIIEARSSIETYGRWVVIVTWPASDNDVDTWLQQPDGQKVWWQSPRSALAHLEQDDLGMSNDDPNAENRERTVLRGIQAGEHIVNLHCYSCYDTPIAVTVSLWRLQGGDRRVATRKIVLRSNGQEATAFRFKLAGSGALQKVNDLPARIVSTS